MKFYFLKASVLFCIALAAQAQINAPIERPSLKVGDNWSYQRTDLWKNELVAGISKRTVVDFRGEEIKFNLTRGSGRLTTGIYTLNLNFAQAVRGERVERVVFQWPLEVGKKIKHQHPWVGNNNSEGTNDGECTYQGFEQVKVPAGEFATIKIICVANWKNITNNGWGRFEDTHWYAPAVKWSVKTKNVLWYGDRLGEQTQDELVEFNLN